MNSRERVQTALAHQEPDRVPIDLGGTVVTSISKVTYAEVRQFLKLPQVLLRGRIPEDIRELHARVAIQIDAGLSRRYQKDHREEAQRQDNLART